MTVNKVIALVLVFIGAQLVCAGIEGNSIYAGNDAIWTVISGLTGFNVVSDSGWNIVQLGAGFWSAFTKIIAWNYSFLYGGAFILRLFLFAITAGVVYGVAQFLRGNTSS